MRFPIVFKIKIIVNNKNFKQSEDSVNFMIFTINDIGTSIISAIKLTHQIKPLTKPNLNFTKLVTLIIWRTFFES